MKRFLALLLALTAVTADAQWYPPGGAGGGGATIPNVTTLIKGNGSGDGADSGINPANVVTTDNVSSLPSQTFLRSIINYTPVAISTVLSGSTYTLVPGTIYYGAITGNKTFAFSPAMTSADPPTIWEGQITGPGTWTVPTLIREGAAGSTTSVSVGSTGYFRAAFDKDGSGNIRMVDTIPQAVTSADVDTSVINDTAYDATSWNGDTDTAPSKNAVRDEVEVLAAATTAAVNNTAYDATSWNGDTTHAPSKDAVRDKIETLGAGGGLGYTLTGIVAAGVSPADSTTYYVGSGPNLLLQMSTWSRARLYVPKAGTIKAVSFHVDVNTGTTSNEAVSHYVRLNDTTDTTLSTSEVWPAAAAASDFTYTGLSIAVVAGDYIAFKIATPAWATNPTSVTMRVVFYIE